MRQSARSMSFTDHPTRWLLATFILAVMHSNAVTAEGKSKAKDLGFEAESPSLPWYEISGTPPDMSKSGSISKRSSDDDGTVEKLITHGEDAYPAEFRYQIALLVKSGSSYYFICGGSLVGKRHVMTAAHCIGYMDGTYSSTVYEHYIMAGVTNLTLGFDSPHVQVHKVKAYKKHHQWTGDLEKGDLAMLYTETSVVNNTYVQYGKVATGDDGNFDYNYCYITGWGLNEDWQQPAVLQWATQVSLPTYRCKQYWAIAVGFKITERLICAVRYPKSICFGDSGGPLSCRGFIAGVASWVETSCRGCKPSGFTRCTFYETWIKKALKKMTGYVNV